jgi:hypothetical protein
VTRAMREARGRDIQGLHMLVMARACPGHPRTVF